MVKNDVLFAHYLQSIFAQLFVVPVLAIYNKNLNQSLCSPAETHNVRFLFNSKVKKIQHCLLWRQFGFCYRLRSYLYLFFVSINHSWPIALMAQLCRVSLEFRRWERGRVYLFAQIRMAVKYRTFFFTANFLITAYLLDYIMAIALTSSTLSVPLPEASFSRVKTTELLFYRSFR